MDSNQFVAARYGLNPTKTGNTISSRFPIPIRIRPILLTTKPKPIANRAQITGETNKSTLVSTWLSVRRSSKLLAAGEGQNDGEKLAGDEDPLPEGLSPELMPRHVAVIVDGSGRWARRRGLPAGEGHVAGIRSFLRLVDLCGRWRIKVLTVFAFSAENWVRSKVEVGFLMDVFEKLFKFELQIFVREGIRISVIGDTSKLPSSLQTLISDTEERSKQNTRLQLIIALNYSGKYDVTQACQSIARKTKDNVISVDGINEAMIEQELETNCTEFPCPDLLIRTSGEVRVSNFMLWQLAYTELFFVQSLWPDFGESEFVEALASFQRRQRRFGGRDS